MLCQNCARNEATTHIKRIVGGEARQLHLCYNCAEHLGYADMFSGFGFNISNMLANFFPEFTNALPESDSSERCPNCGTSFEEIIRSGMMGCAQCYTAFYDKLRPSLSRIHGRATYAGKTGAALEKEGSCKNTSSNSHADDISTKISELRSEMKKAAADEKFELAAKIRDEIAELEGGNKS